MQPKLSLSLVYSAFCLFTIPFAGLSAEPSKQEPPNAAGTWKWSVTTQDGQSFESSVALKQEGGKLTGLYKGRSGESPIEEGKIAGKSISFKVTRKRDDQTFTIKYEGKLEGDQIKGSVILGDGDRTFDWLAKREATKLDPTGTWKWSMARQDGQKLEATMKLRFEGEKLTGSVEGGDWTVELENARIQGDEITFQATRDRDGQKFVSKSKGKVTGNTIKGTIEFVVDGETRVREWEAHRL